MTKEVRTHSVNMELSEPLPPEVAVGRDFVLQVKVSCGAGCDLSGMPVTVTGPDGQVAAIEPRFDQERAPEQATLREIALKAPQQAGEHLWSVRFPAHEGDGIRHEECTLPVCMRTTPHATSLAVWAVP